MFIVYLAGNSRENKDWIEKIKKEFGDFSDGEILYYKHWSERKSFIDLEEEEKRLLELIKGKEDYFIFAKSVGTILALKSVYEGRIDPKKMILCGHPYELAKKLNLPIDDYLRELKISTLFIQNEKDPLFSYKELEGVLLKNSPRDYKIIKIAENSTHDYEEYEKLKREVRSFIEVEN